MGGWKRKSRCRFYVPQNDKWSWTSSLPTVGQSISLVFTTRCGIWQPQWINSMTILNVKGEMSVLWWERGEASVSSHPPGARGICSLDTIYSPFAFCLATGNSLFPRQCAILRQPNYWDILSLLRSASWSCGPALWKQTTSSPSWPCVLEKSNRVPHFLSSQVFSLLETNSAPSHVPDAAWWCRCLLHPSAFLLPRTLSTHGFLEPRCTLLSSGCPWSVFQFWSVICST